MQFYVCVYQQTEDGLKVLIAKKKERITRIHAQPVRPTVANYAGQWVLPGGSPGRGSRAVGAAASREEFREETGHGLRWDVRSYHYENFGYYGVLFAESSDIYRMATQIQANIDTDVPIDDELQEVDVVPIATALEAFQERNWLDIDDESTRELQRRDRGKGYWKDRSWFVDALTFLQTRVSSTASTSVSV